MLLSLGGHMQGTEIDLSAVSGERSDTNGIDHAAELIGFVNAVMADDDDALLTARAALRGKLSPEAFVDDCAVICAFNVVDRIADAAGIPLDEGLAAGSGDRVPQVVARVDRDTMARAAHRSQHLSTCRHRPTAFVVNDDLGALGAAVDTDQVGAGHRVVTGRDSHRRRQARAR